MGNVSSEPFVKVGHLKLQARCFRANKLPRVKELIGWGSRQRNKECEQNKLWMTYPDTIWPRFCWHWPIKEDVQTRKSTAVQKAAALDLIKAFHTSHVFKFQFWSHCSEGYLGRPNKHSQHQTAGKRNSGMYGLAAGWALRWTRPLCRPSIFPLVGVNFLCFICRRGQLKCFSPRCRPYRSDERLSQHWSHSALQSKLPRQSSYWGSFGTKKSGAHKIDRIAQSIGWGCNQWLE